MTVHVAEVAAGAAASVAGVVVMLFAGFVHVERARGWLPALFGVLGAALMTGGVVLLSSAFETGT